MNVVLINPPAERNLEKWDAPEHPNISLAYLAGFLRKNSIPCKVIDSKFEKINLEEVLRRLKNEKFDIVGLTSMTHDVGQAANIAGIIKNRFPGTKVIIGGVHVTALPSETLNKFNEFDLAIIGEGEYTLFETINALREKKLLKNIKGIAFRQDGEIKINPKREWIEDLDKLPFPAWDLFPRANYYNIMTARGCPFNCIFCMSPYGRKVRERSVENVIKEVEWVIKTFNPKIYKFNDETFGFNAERVNKILDLIIEKKLDKTKKMASMRADRVSLDILKKMKMAGFDYIDLGVESGNPEILKRTKKGITMEQVEKAVKMIKSVGIRVGVNVILGHPYETKKTAEQTINFAVRLNGDITAIGIMVPYPGTEIAEIAKRGEGGYRLLSNDWSDYNKQVGNALELENLNRKELEKLQALGYIKIYLYNLRFLDLAKFFWEYRKAGILFIKKQFSK